ncbi:MAG: CoA transferase [Gammaproteobacteria bacterium]|nr:CoA transferase [Gammaproteobacteria bacterium]MCP5198785.1 CoA transferase [Gammaproteobacteria bacterium]
MFDRNFIVLEIANILAGPVTTMAFAELGARVIKLENPHTRGDATRGWKLAGEADDSDISGYFSCANWGKESLACDFTCAAGRDIAHALAARADIVVVSFKPGDEARLGLDYATLSALNPRLIYGQISAYGGDDPRPGFDAILQAEAGFTYLNGEPDGPPTKMPVALIDLLLAHQLKEGLLLALLKRERSGRGSLVTTSLIEAGVASLANQATNYLVGGVVPQRMGSEHPNIVPYGSILACADGREVVIAAATERQYRELVCALGLPELADDPAYATGQLRVRNRDRLLARIRDQAATLASADLAARLIAAKVPFGFVNDMAAVFEQAGARRLLLEAAQDGRPLRGVRTLAFGGDAVSTVTPTPPPHFDQHAETILGGLLGLDRDAIAARRAAGAFGPAPAR